MPSRRHNRCPHGYIAGTCAECRAARPDRVAGVVTRLDEIRTRMAEIEVDPDATEETHGPERDALLREYVELRRAAAGEITGSPQAGLEAKRAELARISRQAAEHPELCESGDGGGERGAPAFIPGLRSGRAESPAQVISRVGNVWGPGGDGTAAGLISRAHTAIEGLEERLTRDGCQKIADAFAESGGWPGMTVKRSKDEQAEAAELFLALSDPFYASAFRSILRYPQDFMAGGTGYMAWSDEERLAWSRVRQNDLCRAAFAEAGGATGGYALPLQLDPVIIFTNAGAASPHRKLARNVIGTSNVWEGVTSAGSTANWYAEAAVVTDTTPAIGQLAITPYRSSVWISGSLEVLDDTTLDEQVPALIAEAKFRLEATAFAVGTGSTQPYGLVTRGASDATTGALSAAQIYGLLANLPPRFRVYDSARPVWMANVAIMNAARQIPAFTGAVNSIVDDTGPDGPRMLGLPFQESSAMSALNTAGAKNLLLGDMSQYVIVDRQPSVLLFEPLFKDQATGRPAGQRGWFNYSRVGADITTAGAAYGSNAFVFHTV
jgi:HK97 family phage major capsid protein